MREPDTVIVKQIAYNKKLGGWREWNRIKIR